MLHATLDRDSIWTHGAECLSELQLPAPEENLSLSERIILTAADHAAQTNLILGADSLGAECFQHISSAAGQLAFLERFDWRRHDSESLTRSELQSLKSSFLSQALDQEVRHAVENMRFLASEAPAVTCDIPAVGSAATIHFLRQVHTIYCEEAPELKEIGRLQERLLAYLHENNFKTVFLEGLYRDFTAASLTGLDCGQYHYWLLPSDLRQGHTPGDIMQHVRDAFAAYAPGSPLNDHQLHLLGALGAAVIFAVSRDDVSLMSTITAEDESRISRLQRHPRITPERSRFLCNEVRETRALRKIDAALCAGNASEVALVYGALHDFKQDVSSFWNSSIALKSVDWPEHRRAFAFWQAWNL